MSTISWHPRALTVVGEGSDIVSEKKITEVQADVDGPPRHFPTRTRDAE